MPELEQRLHALSAEIDWPATPELRVPAPEPRRRSRRPLVLVLAVLLVALAASFAVPGARTAILRFFHLGGVTVQRVDRLPTARPRVPLRLGAPVSLAEASVRLGRPVLLPAGRRPGAAYFDRTLAGGAVNLRYGPPAHPRLLVTEFLTANLPYAEKYVAASGRVEPVSVGGHAGLWIPEQHVVEIGPLPARLAGSTLLWTQGPVTIRLEGDLSKRAAVGLGRTFRR